MTPTTKKWLIRGGIAVAVLGIGGYAYAKSKAPAPPKTPSPTNAVKAAIRALGADEDPIELADLAYTMAYPKCPPKLDPDDSTHADCIQKWLGLRDLALELGEKPKRGGSTSAQDDGPAKDMSAWLDSLTQSQRSGLRNIIGSKYYDPIKNAAEAGDDSATVAAVYRFKRDAEQFASEHPIDAYKQYVELKDLLGGKIDELLRKAKQYA